MASWAILGTLHLPGLQAGQGNVRSIYPQQLLQQELSNRMKGGIHREILKPTAVIPFQLRAKGPG